MRKLKTKYPGNTFQNLLHSSISVSFKNYLSKRNFRQPNHVFIAKSETIVDISLFVNNYQTSIEKVTISISDGVSSIQSIMKPDRIFSTKLVLTVIPSFLMKYLLLSQPQSVGASNIPGPRKELVVGNFRLKRFVFFAPKIGSSFFTCGSLSYNGKMSFGLMSDSAEFQSEDDLAEILSEIINEIKRLDN